METIYRNAIVYFYPINQLGFTNPIKRGKRVKIWIKTDSSNVTDIEFILTENEEINLGEVKQVRIMVLSPIFFDKLIESEYRIYFGEVGDKRLGELIPLFSE